MGLNNGLPIKWDGLPLIPHGLKVNSQTTCFSKWNKKSNQHLMQPTRLRPAQLAPTWVNTSNPTQLVEVWPKRNPFQLLAVKRLYRS